VPVREKKPFPGPRRRVWGADELFGRLGKVGALLGHAGGVFEVCQRLDLPLGVCWTSDSEDMHDRRRGGVENSSLALPEKINVFPKFHLVF